MDDAVKRYPLADALAVGEKLASSLAPFVDKIEIVGSVRRAKPMVKDVELLFVPKISNQPFDLFGTREVDIAFAYIEFLVKDGILSKRLSIRGVPAGWGPKNKLAVFLENGMPVDLFACAPNCWWNSLVIRTGGKETNLKLTTGAQKLGHTLNAYGSGVTCSDGSIIPSTSERHVFELCGVPYVEAKDRE